MTDSERHLITSNVRTLFPGYFAMVMATLLVVFILYRREFHSEVLHILRE